MRKIAGLIAGIVLYGGAMLMAPLGIAQIEVIDPMPDETGYQGSNRSTVATPVPAPAPAPVSAVPALPVPAPQEAANSSSEAFYQLQLMQEEILQLRGVVEQQQHDIEQLKQQRIDDLISLDKRLGAIGNSSVSTPAPTPTPAPASSAATAAVTTTPPPAAANPQDVADGGEDQAYNDAYAKVSKHDFKGATAGFLRYLERYPQGVMVPNANYWLGELYLLDGKHNEAKARFEILPKQYPQHRKVPDAIFKLARIYDLQGDREKSRTLLNQIISQYGNSSAAAKARKYLQENP